MSNVLDLDLDFFRFVSSVLEDLMAPSYVTSVNFPFAGVFDLLGFMLCGLVWYGSHPLWLWYGMVHDGMVW